MSVMLFTPDQFNRVYTTLRKYEIPQGLTSLGMENSEILRAFQVHPFKNPLDYKEKIRIFCEELYIANQMAYERQYGENHGHITIEALEFKEERPLESIHELLKALQAIRYNLYDNNGSISEFRTTIIYLDKLIEALKDLIIDNLPEYQKAEWGGF